MNTTLTVGDLDQIITALRREKRAKEDFPIHDLPGDHAVNYKTKQEGIQVVERVLTKVQTIKNELSMIK
jgi:LDH2 family malate/lactate/ureidoglycolate dehydrogenase